MRKLLGNISQRERYGAVIVLSIVLSVGGVLVAVFVTHDKDDAGRGGGVAVIIAFWILFLRRNYGERVYGTLLKMLPALEQKIDDIATGKDIEAFSNDEQTRLLLGIIGRINVESDEQRVQNKALFWASFVGTFFWCFGDLFYKGLVYLLLPPG